MKLIEFFAGSRSLSKQAEILGFETFTVDINPFEGIDLVADVEFLTAKDFPFIPDASINQKAGIKNNSYLQMIS